MTNNKSSDNAHYRWNDDSHISSMQTKFVSKDITHCIIYPKASADPQIVADMMVALSEISERTPYFVAIDGKAAIMVPAVENIDNILSVMKHSGAIEGTAKAITPTEEKELPFADKIKKNMMNIGGAVGLLGHVSLMLKGIKHRQMDVFGTGLGILNPMTQALLGTGDHERKYEHLMNKMQQHLVETGVLDRPVVTIEPQKSFVENVGSFIHENPQLVGFGLGNIGSMSMMYNSFSPDNTNPIADRMISGTSIIGNCAVMFMPERVFPKNHEYAKLTEDPLRCISEFVQSQPLKFNGLLNASDNLCWGYKVWNAIKDPNIDAFDTWSTGVTAVSFGASTAIVSFLSTKEEPMADRAAKYDKIYDLAANLLIEIPADNRAAIMQQMAGFLSAQNIVTNAGMSIDDISQGIKKHLDVMEQTGWIPVEASRNATTKQATVDEPSQTTPSNIIQEPQTQSLEKMYPNELVHSL